MVRVQTKVNNKKASCKVIYLHPKLKLFNKFVHHSTCYITALGCTRSNCSCCLFSWRSSLLKLHSSPLSLNFFSDFSLRHHMVFWAELFIFLSDNFELLFHSSLFHLSNCLSIKVHLGFSVGSSSSSSFFSSLSPSFYQHKLLQLCAFQYVLQNIL